MKARIFLLATTLLIGSLAMQAGTKLMDKDFDKAVKAYNEERYENALSLFNKVVEAKPDNGYAWAFIASIMYSEKKPDEAFDAAHKAIKLLPAADTAFLAWTHSELARIYTAKHDTIAALQELTTSIQLCPADLDFRAYRANLYQKHGDWQEAENDFNYMIAHDPKSIDGLLGLGSVQGAQDKHEEAVATFSRAIATDSTDADGYGYRAVEYFNLRRYTEALDDAIQALSLEENNSHALWLIPFISNQDATMVINKIEAKRNADTARTDYWNNILQRLTSAPATSGRY